MENTSPLLPQTRCSDFIRICRLYSLFGAVLLCLVHASPAVSREHASPAVSRETATSQQAPQQVTVELASGRVFTAMIDERSDDKILWLRFQTSSTILMRPVEWNRVVAAHVDGKKITSAELQASLETFASSHHHWRPGDPPRNTNADNNSTDAQQAAQALGSDRRVQSIQVDAFLGNWDADVESDGLIVHIYPLDDQGNVVEVRATANLSLIGVTGTRRPSPSGRALASNRKFPILGRWTRAINANDFDLTGVSLRLPFGAIHPEFNPRIRSQALVHIKLSIPGHGVFETTAAPTTVRPINVIRNQVEAASGTRFLPIETIGR